MTICVKIMGTWQNYENSVKMGEGKELSYAIFPLFTYSICYRQIYRNLMGGIICGGAYDLKNNQN